MKLSSKSRTLWIEWKQDTKFPTEKHKNIKDVEAAVAIVGTRNASNIVNAIYYSITGPVYINNIWATTHNLRCFGFIYLS